jgi:hypothetical protein
MKLLDELRQTADRLDSVFQARLMHEDIARLQKLAEMARTTDAYEHFEKAGLYLGWTQGDMRTFELTADLKPFLKAFYGAANDEPSPEHDPLVRKTWIAFNKARMAKLIGCL